MVCLSVAAFIVLLFIFIGALVSKRTRVSVKMADMFALSPINFEADAVLRLKRYPQTDVQFNSYTD